ncbi:conserved hypothetical protein [Thioalkalivibrio sulfidiphilus HL-EbGr7]|uniref:Cyclic diguanosine monophosphate-binding protein n=1 Tax=Thioalkalivibrio sulfidiphilus (strain HL-EbGR7) TaxID=396588 RepID=B8GTW9_THISH|nr:PilZ domain-containing protein [Thioalkalivibrio sulfidiphilus]ACL73213.1 conserved hypothetical protein [Thioalkalivibrio sulfidiphilus HL-EbGr7]
MTQSGSSERRHFHRISFEGVAYFECDGSEHRVRLLDLSLHGALVNLESEEQGDTALEGSHCRLRVPLSPDLDIHLDTRIARVTGSELGLAVERLDLDSAQHLKRLVELNLGDDELLHRDLAALFES